MKSFSSEGSTQLSNENRGLSYRPEFKEWVAEHPGVMGKVVKLIEQIPGRETIDEQTSKTRMAEKAEDITEGDIHISHLPQPFSDIFKISVGEDTFFMKRDVYRLMQDTRFGIVGGQGEYTDSLIAKVDLGSDPDIEVIDFQLGYTCDTGENRVAYFISKWEDLKTADVYLDDPNFPESERVELQRKVDKAVHLFEIYRDIKPSNMFYDSVTKKIKMFDLNMKPWERR